MRPFEIVLMVANLAAYSLLVFPPFAGLAWLRHLAPLALLAAALQVLVEGQRWQMVPAYILSGLFFLVWLAQIANPLMVTKRWLAILAALLGLIALVVSVIPPLALPVFRLPQPGGPYQIGTLTYHWVSNNREEIFTPTPGDHRELMVQLWYPAQVDPSAPRAAYVPDARTLEPLARMIHLPAFTFKQLQYVRTHAVPSAPALSGEARFPVLIFSAGRGGFRQESTHMFEELVSHGYIVAAIDSPYASSGVLFPDGRLVAIDPRLLPGPTGGFPSDLGFFNDVVLPYLARDVIFVMDRLADVNQSDPYGILTGRLDLDRIGMLGPSLGGLVGAQASYLDPRIKALLAMDVHMPDDVIEAGLKVPAMFISREEQWMEREGWYRANIDETQYTMRSVYERLPGDGYLVLVPGMYHPNFSDAAMYSPLASQIGLTGPIDGQRSGHILDAYTLAFFDKHLKDQPSLLLDGPSEEFPEVLFESRSAAGRPAVDLAQQLAGTQWGLVSSGAPGLEQPVDAGHPITLAFNADGTASGSDGCNSYSGRWEASGNKIAIRQVNRTRMACQPESVNRQAEHYLQALENAGRFAFSGGHLVIFFDNRQGVLNFTSPGS